MQAREEDPDAWPADLERVTSEYSAYRGGAFPWSSDENRPWYEGSAAGRGSAADEAGADPFPAPNSRPSAASRRESSPFARGARAPPPGPPPSSAAGRSAGDATLHRI